MKSCLGGTLPSTRQKETSTGVVLTLIVTDTCPWQKLTKELLTLSSCRICSPLSQFWWELTCRQKQFLRLKPSTATITSLKGKNLGTYSSSFANTTSSLSHLKKSTPARIKGWTSKSFFKLLPYLKNGELTQAIWKNSGNKPIKMAKAKFCSLSSWIGHLIKS